MKCPVCTTVDLLMSERQGIEIDYCAQCRGVWLDRGELDKIIERSGQDLGREPAAAPPAQPAHAQQPIPPQPYDRDHYRDGDDDYYRRKRRKSFLEELFD
jgi:Zn-finger nucleic acid-binding protein